MTVDWHSALCQVFLAWLLCIKVFFAWSVSFFCSETSSRTGLTNCGATLIAEDHPVPVLTQHVHCRQLQSGEEYDSPPQRNRPHDHHCCRLNPLAPTAHKVVLVLWSQAGLPGSRGFQSFGPDLAHHRQTTHLLLQRKKTRNHFPQINIILRLMGFQAKSDLACHGFCKWNGLEYFC